MGGKIPGAMEKTTAVGARHAGLQRTERLQGANFAVRTHIRKVDEPPTTGRRRRQRLPLRLLEKAGVVDQGNLQLLTPWRLTQTLAKTQRKATSRIPLNTLAKISTKEKPPSGMHIKHPSFQTETEWKAE